MKFINKRTIAAAALTAGTAAVLFGGSSVATAWTQASTGNVHADAASFSNTFQTGDLSLTNALPGDQSVDPVTVSYQNNGSTPEDVVLTITKGTSPLTQYVEVIGIPGSAPIPATTFPTSIDLGKIPAHQGFNFSGLKLKLDDNAPSSVAGGVFDATYTLTATATH